MLLDNFVNSSREVISRIEKITGIKPLCYEVDVCDITSVRALFSEHTFEACLLYTSPSPRDKRQSRMPSSA